jgi:hypothetical protein
MASQSFFTADPESGDGVLSHLKKMKSGDIVAMRMVGSMMTEISDLGWSPQVAVFTTVPPAGSYRASPFELLEHQTYNNSVIGSDQVIDAMRIGSAASGGTVKAKMLRTKPSIIPDGVGLQGPSSPRPRQCRSGAPSRAGLQGIG